jgi:hypothetical protein
MHEKLISANIALFRGERAETLRLIDELERENPTTLQDHPSMVMWLTAHAQTQNNLRLQGMHELIARTPPDDYYHQLTRDYLSEEDFYSEKLQPARGSATRQLIAVIGVVLVLGVLAAGVLNTGDVSTAVALDASPTPIPTVVNPADLPDKSRAIVADSFTARYVQGILQVLAIEDRSERVIYIEDGLLAEPVAGARFYALSVTFECRLGICNAPPEAKLDVLLNNGTSLSVREDLTIAGQPQFEAIALGRATSSWIVFELPTLNQPTNLIVYPESDTGVEPQVYDITLPEGN